MKKAFSLLTVFLVFLNSIIVYAESDEWICPNCGSVATMFFCSECGEPRPVEEWVCEKCGETSKGNFCSNCGAERPSIENDASGNAPVERSKEYIDADGYTITGKWKNVGSDTYGQVQEDAIIVFDGIRCNFYSPADIYAFYKDEDSYKLDCTGLLGDTVSFKVNIIDEDNVDIELEEGVIELTRVEDETEMEGQGRITSNQT